MVRIQDVIRGEVAWNTDTLGDFVLLRSNGLPVYNFCVAIDDASMRISHVIRAEEHLPNTLRQVWEGGGGGRQDRRSRRAMAVQGRAAGQVAGAPGGGRGGGSGVSVDRVACLASHSSAKLSVHSPLALTGADLPGPGLPHPHLWPCVTHPGTRQEQAVQAARSHISRGVQGGGLPGCGE
jgi:hypothetical protein